MIIFIIVSFCCICTLGFIFNKANTPIDNFIISILIDLCSFFSYFFDSFKESVIISIRIIGYYSHSSIDLGHLFPMRHLSRSIILNCFEFKRISISFFKFITSMLVEIAYLSDC